MRFWVGGISLAFLMGCALIREDDRPHRADRIFGMLMGSAVADALAGPHEGRSTEASQTFLEEGGWVDAFDTPYSRWYQSHWNVYEQGASSGTYTDDSRLRLFVAESMLDFRGEGVMDQLFLAEQIFHKYRQSRTRFVDADKDVLKECFLDMWFWWELTKLSTSVRIPETELLSPPARREELLDENEEPTGYWKLVDREAQPLDKNLKAEWHDGSYQEGKEWPIGQITLLPLATYFPGEPDKAFRYLLGMNFLDIGNAPVYPAFISALLADGLGGRE
ncbi:ADP-ribosylglycohydrolase family protein [Opitutia bacterium ISCC 51]|nr:ADP-ribosylglycohydrolase family protein [Opitutae bacterium ISCC 51]QXD30294.1 ADP-ribosylglycohydrolase family protein [Opitutae bacterium ISCC 52]